MTEIARIALIGDLHGSWDDWDSRYFNASDYALLLFTGDLGSGTRDNGVRIARSLGRLAKPAYVMPGNNDVRHAPEIAAEIGHQRGLFALRRIGAAVKAGMHMPLSGQVRLCGYSVHPLELAGRSITLLAARPHALGGGDFSYPERLSSSYGVSSMEASARRLRELVESAPSEELLVLAHNGPSGLGSAATDPWGCDFRAEAGDWGDADLADALAHARKLGKRVLAVIAGHMHSPTCGGDARTWQLRRHGTLYVNPARVPRIFEDARAKYRHHAVLEIGVEARGCAREQDVEARGCAREQDDEARGCAREQDVEARGCAREQDVEAREQNVESVVVREVLVQESE
jgi:uncharacterized protein (TIGR04168 family)